VEERKRHSISANARWNHTATIIYIIIKISMDGTKFRNISDTNGLVLNRLVLNRLSNILGKQICLSTTTTRYGSLMPIKFTKFSEYLQCAEMNRILAARLSGGDRWTIPDQIGKGVAVVLPQKMCLNTLLILINQLVESGVGGCVRCSFIAFPLS